MEATDSVCHGIPRQVCGSSGALQSGGGFVCLLVCVSLFWFVSARPLFCQDSNVHKLCMCVFVCGWVGGWVCVCGWVGRCVDVCVWVGG